ncbi:MAG: division/cell wall cluster transcriptional repressor MraZ [Flavobacteriales bacterium]|nr:division/cell wall cluster transcriptional repressor MraZ [Flavobacteriales bacterium]
MLNLLGEHICRLDDKGRLLFPAKLRKQLEEVVHHGLVINRDIFFECLVLYPKPEWDRVLEEMSLLSRYNKRHQQFQRLFMNGATLLELDPQGRLLIPPLLLEHAGVDLAKNNEVVLSAMGEKIELWGREQHRRNAEDNKEQFEDMAEDVRKVIDEKKKSRD